MQACTHSRGLPGSTLLTSDRGFARPSLAVPRAPRPVTSRSTPSTATSTVTTHAVPPQTAAGEPTTAWASFAAAASGEWDGVTVTFDRDGEAQQLPEYYVPEAYRDWGVELYDWQSQCSMLADADGLRYTLRRLMPTVGCEADAVAFTEDATSIFAPGAAAVTPEGGYSCPPQGLADAQAFKAQAEHCFPLEEPGQRIRVVQNLKRMGPDGVWKVLSVEVHRERRDGPYNGRRELAGCGGGMDPFAQKPALATGEALGGAWTANGVRFDAQLASAAVTGAAMPAPTESLRGNVVGLPLGAWSAVHVEGADAECAAGVVLEDGSVKMAVQRLKDGALAGVYLMTLSRSD